MTEQDKEPPRDDDRNDELEDSPVPDLESQGDAEDDPSAD
jgi:hypothetical protein